ncbi:MAG: hypothetical protein IPF62_11255 [Bacteroidetes bacterium]|nr:hypothetical protein [Bacteroidota bacterium]
MDLNPTAIELGKLSLWLNVIHKDMETPFFSNRLAVGNAVVGHNIFGALKYSEQAAIDLRSYDEKERLADQRNRHNAPYFKLKMVMDYWCSLWFWDVRDAKELPDANNYWQDISAI